MSDRDLDTKKIPVTRSVSKEDLFGIFFLKKTGSEEWNSYYGTVDVLRPLFQEIEFRRTVAGFYVNHITNKSQNTVRISYFTDRQNMDKVVAVFRNFFHAKELYEIDSCPPDKALVADSYGGEPFEERFRNFLNRETQIGLELLQENRLHSRSLFATYRWQVRKASLSFEEHFEKTFLKYSSTYRSWSDAERRRFFSDLKEWPNPPQVDWAHMMVNFVLGNDWNYVFGDPQYLSPGKPLPIAEINNRLSAYRMEHQIPLDWKANSP